MDFSKTPNLAQTVLLPGLGFSLQDLEGIDL